MPTLALHGHSAVGDPTEGGEGCILVFGGRASDSWTGDVLKYHTLNNAWTILPYVHHRAMEGGAQRVLDDCCTLRHARSMLKLFATLAG